MAKKNIWANQSFRFIIFILILTSCYLTGRFFNIDIEIYRTVLMRFPFWLSGIIFVFLYISLTMLIIVGPKDILRVTSAVLFGPIGSTILVTLGELGNLTALFFISRQLGRGYVIKKFNIKEDHIKEVRRNTQVLDILAIRLNPLFPLRLMDIGFGLSSVSFRKYFMVSVFATPFRVLWLQFILAGIGTSVFHPQKLIEYLLEHQSILYYSAMYFFVIAVVTVLALVSKVVKKKS